VAPKEQTAKRKIGMNFIGLLFRGKKASLSKIFISTIIFLTCSCSTELPLSSSLTDEERTDLDYFFRLILFDDPGGAFVLFGSKPLCEISYFDTEGDANSPFCRNPANGWKALQKILQKYPPKRYVVTLRPDRSIILADIQKTALVLAENYEVFRSCAKIDFHPLEIVFELENPESKFWNAVFGKQNALMWSWNANCKNRADKTFDYFKNNPMTTSTPRISIEPGTLARYKIRIASRPENLEIPFFGVVEGDRQAEGYAKEKKRIKEIYRGKNLVEITLRRLLS
jgi:hypothetical protein